MTCLFFAKPILSYLLNFKKIILLGKQIAGVLIIKLGEKVGRQGFEAVTSWLKLTMRCQL